MDIIPSSKENAIVFRLQLGVVPAQVAPESP
jgi:hypothetical protein